LRTKKQETRLNLHEHDDDDDDEIGNGKTKVSEIKDSRHPEQRLQRAEKCKYKLLQSFLPILLDKITLIAFRQIARKATISFAMFIRLSVVMSLYMH
jgi:hypothetical protein